MQQLSIDIASATTEPATLPHPQQPALNRLLSNLTKSHDLNVAVILSEQI